MTKRKNPGVTRAKKRQLWVERTQQWSGLDPAAVEELLLTPRTQSIRLNPLRPRDISPELISAPIDWCPNGFSPNPEQAEAYDALSRDGHLYIQNAASWLPVLALDPQPGQRILDMCAAPGGKSSHIQAITGNRAELICNDNSRPRLMKLQANLTRLGVRAEYSLADATRPGGLGGPESYDAILLDAPCSGEGLMTLRPEDAKLFDSWSPAHIRRLSDLQKRLISHAWRLLRPGGTLVYSTCTMAPEENEVVVNYLLRRHPEAHVMPIDIADLPNRTPCVRSWNGREFSRDLSGCLRLLPGQLTEAFFVAKIHKSATDLHGISDA